MTKQTWLLALLIVAVILEGCRETADSFFSGRPSGMAMAHNRVLGGSVESVIDLLRIPRRFPDAEARHKSDWQEPVIAWWRAEKGWERILAALAQLTQQVR